MLQYLRIMSIKKCVAIVNMSYVHSGYRRGRSFVGGGVSSKDVVSMIGIMNQNPPTHKILETEKKTVVVGAGRRRNPSSTRRAKKVEGAVNKRTKKDYFSSESESSAEEREEGEQQKVNEIEGKEKVGSRKKSSKRSRKEPKDLFEETFV